MQCLSTVTYAYLVNGSAQDHVRPSRGLRQGDPLSPYIFILCSEVLSGLCNKAQRIGKLSGIRVATRSPRVNHLLFADDTMFFCRSDPQSCHELMKIIHKYEQASGQMINKDKSAITFSSKTNNHAKERAKVILGIQKEGGLGKYLGLPEHFDRKKKDLFSMIVDRIRQKARSWSSKQLSQVGRMVMLKLVLAAMPTYTMTCFKLPVSMYKRMQSALTRFWWDGNQENKKMCWISWKKMVESKRDGGLGFRDLQNFNDTLLAKLSWRVLNQPNCLLARVLLNKYCHETTFLDCDVSTTASHGWRGICIGRDLLKPNLGMTIGDGTTTRIWTDPWLSLDEQSRPMGPHPQHAEETKVESLLSPTTGEWDREKIRAILPSHEKQILELRTSKLGGTDKLIWLHTEDGNYTAKSGYYERLKTDNELIMTGEQEEGEEQQEEQQLQNPEDFK
ncbi:unnamed protein product [Microthlaspi erraticum]|nr:unnamed protein product [Microthlaspi erraticum]